MRYNVNERAMGMEWWCDEVNAEGLEWCWEVIEC